MSNFKISVDVNIDLSESTKNFINALLKAEAQKAEAPKAEASKAEALKAEAPKAEASKAEASKAEAPKAEAPKAEASKATVTIDMVRKALSEKVNDNRASIKEKLTSLGAPSVTKLDHSKYEEMYNYLISL